ncbi:hypothetical protein JCM11491_001401 [Sporobolomyces phaffii]
MSKFVTRQVDVPDYLLDDPETAGAIPSNWGEPPPPRAPDDAPPSSSSSSSPQRAPVPVTSGSIGRASSLSLHRAVFLSASSSNSPALPDLAPASPFDPPYPGQPLSSSSDGFSTSRTPSSSSPALSRSSSSRRGGGSAEVDAFSPSPLPTNPTPSLRLPLDTFHPSPPPAPPLGPTATSKRSMFRSLAFGRARSSMTTTTSPSPNSTSSSRPTPPPLASSHPLSSSSSAVAADSSSTTRRSDPAAAAAAATAPFGVRPHPDPDDPAAAIRWSTVSDPPVVRHAAPATTTTTAQLNRRPSRQQLATGRHTGSGGGFPITAGSARESADRWWFEAQAAGLGFGFEPTAATETTQTTTTSEGGVRDASSRVEDAAAAGDEDDDDDDEGRGGVGWARRGERYTRDLGRADDDEVQNGRLEPLGPDDAPGGHPEADGGSPEARCHDAPQSPAPEALLLRTPTTLLPALPSSSLALLDPPPLVGIESNHPAAPPPPVNSSDLPFRREDGGKLSLPVYSGLSLDPVTPAATRTGRRNRSDGDDLDDEDRAELETRLRGFELEDRPTSPPRSPNSLADFVVAVVGPRNVGKSSVVRKGLKPRSTEPATVIQEDDVGNRVTTTTTTFTIGGNRRTIEVLEIDMHLLRYNDEGVIWPDGLPQCEGAMLCYDSTDPDALSSLSVLLKAFWTRGSDVPLIVLACKALAPEVSGGGRCKNATDPTDAARVCNVYGAGIVTLDGGLDDANRKTKESFKYIIRQIMENRGEGIRPASASVASTSPATSRRGSEQYATTSRSPFSAAGTGPPSSSRRPSAVSNNDDEYEVHGDGLGLGLSVVQEAPLGTPTRRDPVDEPDEHPRPVGHGPSSAFEEPLSPKSQAPTYVSDSVPAYEPPGERSRSQRLSAAETSPTQQRSSPTQVEAERRTSTTKVAPLDLFFTREDMIDKFLYAAVTGNDEAYVTLFLIAYRRFATPYDVLGKLIERFEFVAQKLKSDPLLSRFAQMKICGVLSVWMQSYAGDFSAPATFGVLSPFLHSLLPSGATWVAHYALELIPLLPAISAQSDPDASWALPDHDHDHDHDLGTPIELPPPPNSGSRRPSIAPSYASSGSNTNLSVAPPPGGSPLERRSPHPGSDAGTLDTQDSGDHQSFGTTTSGGGAPSTFLSSRPPRAGGGLHANAAAALALVEVSNMVMEMREEDVALQITRLAWDMFGGMTPRDLLRHVLAPRDPANPRVALRDSDTNVVKSIAFVNYLANWTASLILVQGKLKSRARILEKLVLVALALREHENFDSLMGVLAGLNSQPVFRLSETFELVTHKLDGVADPRMAPRRSDLAEADAAAAAAAAAANRLPKKLRSLNRLMAATKSFSAYRLALANSGVNMIPYLGVHLQGITVVNEIKSDLRDGKVNWTKFSQMGRSAAIVLDCSRIAPTLPVDKLVERAIVDIPVLDEERQYTLSYQHQPRQSDKPSGTRSRLRTLAKSTFATNP